MIFVDRRNYPSNVGYKNRKVISLVCSISVTSLKNSFKLFVKYKYNCLNANIKERCIFNLLFDAWLKYTDIGIF